MMAAAVAAIVALATQLVPNQVGADESAYYTVDHLVPPEGAVIEVGGMDWMPDGRLVVSTRRGQVWLVENALAADPKEARFHLLAEGLQEGLGLSVVEGELFVLQRSELSRLSDVDGDDFVDRIDTISNQWGNSGHYHEFAFGLPRLADGSFYISLNVSFGDPQWWHGRSTAPYRGWVMRISPEGTVSPFASGFRSPCGLGTNADGDLFVTENQGDWMPACPIFHVQEGRFYGHPASLRWTSEYEDVDRIPSDTTPPDRERADAAVWIPYDWSRSAGNLVADLTGGRFGPFERDLFVAEMTNGYVLRAQLERVQGEYQGAVFPFRRQVGSAVRLLFAPDGTLFAGLTDRGWGGQAPRSGIARLRWTGVVPMEVQRIHLLQDGFELTFTRPLASGLDPGQVSLQQYDYDWWWEYGSPLRHITDVAVEAVELAADLRTAIVRAPALRAGMVARIKLSGVVGEGGLPLLHDELAYTVNQLPEGPRQSVHVAKLVPPPPPRESSHEGTLMLMQTDALDAWTGEGWSVGDVALDPEDPAKLVRKEPPVAEEPPDRHSPQTLSTLDAAGPAQLTSRFEFGDLDLSFDFLVTAGGEGALFLMGRYGIRIGDGALLGGEGWPQRAPDFDAFRGPGEWHYLSVRFQAPRFDESGRRLSDARLQRVMIDDVLLHDELDLGGPSLGAPLSGEAPRGPLVIRSELGAVAVRHLVVRDRTPPPSGDEAGWVRLFDGTTLDGWTISGGAEWRVERGEIVGNGPAGHLFSPRGDYRNLELRARCRISDGGNSGMYVRAAYGEGWPQGYEAQINSTHEDPVKTGSLYGRSTVLAQLIAPDTWFTQQISCRDEPEGVRITVRVSGVVVNEFLDPERTFASGHVALQQHHEGSVVRYTEVEVRELH